MNAPFLITDSDDPSVAEAASLLGGWRVIVCDERSLGASIAAHPDARAVLAACRQPTSLRLAVESAHLHAIPLVVACADETMRRRAVELRAEEWYFAPASATEIAARIRSAIARVPAGWSPRNGDSARRAGGGSSMGLEELLLDGLTGLPSLPVMLDRLRPQIRERGELIVVYLHFVRYAKLEELYGWEKLDAVLETTAAAVRENLSRSALGTSTVMSSFVKDDDFVIFHVPAKGEAAASDAEVTDLVTRLEAHVAKALEAAHGVEVAALFDVYVGRAHVFHDPRIRFERLVYRAVRDAAHAARGVEERERARRVNDLRTCIRDGAIDIEFHPIVVTDTGAVLGYEALARGRMRSLRSPLVMFDVAAEADLMWELGRLCRRKAIEGMKTALVRGELLFLNVDPGDFNDPAFDAFAAEVDEPSRVVIEITERTAITNYRTFRERLAALRARGYRFAVDDAGSGYAGLGSIANLDPDFIKLDLSLISHIDTSALKQNLVRTIVRFADEHGGGAQVVAEGVERVEEFETVRSLGVHLVQGFYLYRPAESDTPADIGRSNESVRELPARIEVPARPTVPGTVRRVAADRRRERR